MWRGEEDFTVLCSLYKFGIKLITVDDGNEPTVTLIKPNPVLERFSDFPAGQVPDMIVLHQKNSHYDLIVPKDSQLAIEGGFDYLRGKNKAKEEEEKEKEEDLIEDEKKKKVEEKTDEERKRMKEEKRDEEDESVPRDQEEVESPRNKTINLEEKISELEAGMKCLQEKVTRLFFYISNYPKLNKNEKLNQLSKQNPQ